MCIYTGCPRRNVPDFGRVFLMLKYSDITQNTYVQSWTVTEIMAREKCGLLVGPRTVHVSWQSYPCRSLSMESYDGNSAHASPKLHMYFLQGDDVLHVAAALWMVGRLVVQSCWNTRMRSQPCYVSAGHSCVMYSAWNPKDNYDMSASVFVVQFNGFMSLTS